MNKSKYLRVILIIIAVFALYAFINGTYSIYKEIKPDTIDLSVLDPSTTFAVNFNSNGGSAVSPSSYSRTYNQTIGAFPESPTKANNNFAGWYTDPTSGTKVTEETLVTGNITLYAHWIKIVCKKAVTGTLHTETCVSGASCDTHGGYNANDVITYGTIPGPSSPLVGDAYDCDVNDDGVWDDETERFYYVRDYGTTDPTENAVLIHYTSFDENGQMDSSNSRLNYYYDDALTHLPTSSLWTNSALISENGNVTRFLSRDDLVDGCGTSNVGALTTCEFILENSRYQSGSLGRAGIWLLKEGDTLYRVQTESYAITHIETDSKNAARPVIQIPSNTIEGFTTRIQYAVTLDSDGGNPSEYTIRKYNGEQIGALPIPEKTGYTFAGWYTGQNGSGTQITDQTLVTGANTYYAKWVQNITITFNPGQNGTVSPSSKEIATGAAIGAMPTPENGNLDFLGWFTSASGGTQVTESTVFNASTEIFAHWEDNSMQYVFHIPGECTFTSSGITDGPNGSCISTINPTGSSIDYTDSALSVKKYIDSQIALYDSTNHDKDYEIHFEIVSYDGSQNESQATFFNTKKEDTGYPGLVVRKSTNSANQIEFASRKTSGANESVTLNANNITKMTVYRTNGEIYYSLNDNEKLLVNDLTQYNPVFDLTTWFGGAPTDGTATSARRFLTGTLSNIYIKIGTNDNATVTFDPNYQGSSTFTQDYTTGQAMGTLPNDPTRNGYTFLGWFTDPANGTQVTTNTVINDDIRFYAHWIQNITITFNPGQDGTVSPTTKTFTPGTAIGTLPTPERTGYTFLGWFTDDGTYLDEVTPQTTFSTNGSIYAKWIQNITITFNPGQDGTVSPTTKTFTPGTAIGTLPTPERTGYVFTGWYTDPTAGTEVTTQTTFLSSDTIYAHWEENTNITVTFDPNGGTVSPVSKTFAVQTAIGTLPIPTDTPDQTGNIFVGWYTDNTWTTEVTSETVFNANTTIIAKWVEDSYVACVGSTCYTTLDSAINVVPTTGEKTTVKIIQNITTTATTTIPSTKWVELDIGANTISTSTASVDLFTNQGTIDIINGTLNSSGGNVITNKDSGIVNIKNGSITSSGRYIIQNKNTAVANISGGALTYNKPTETEYKVVQIDGGTVNITSGILSCNAKAATINVNAGVLNMSGGEIRASNTYKGQGIYNNGGTTTISGTAYIENVSNQVNANGRAAVHNNTGTVNILGGTIISLDNAAVKNSGTMTIGTNDGTIDTTSPVLQGSKYGLETVSGKTVYIYDGIFKGQVSTNNKAISNESFTNIGSYQYVHDTETIDSVQYAVAYLENPVQTCTVTFNPGQDGTVSPLSKTFTAGTAIGELPTPQKAGYTFNGWFTAASGGVEVTDQTEFSQDDTIYAHWTENITINFNVNSGDTIEYNSKTLTVAGAIGTLPTASKANSEFLGWFSAANGGEKLLTTTEMTASDNGTTYYAHYTNATTVCRPATVLHTDGNTTFGQIPTGSSLSGGDAFDCDVNGDGIFDATNERFYYLTNTSDGKAVFIFSNNIHQNNGTAAAMCKADAVAYGTTYTAGPTTAMEELPTTAQWSNVSLYTQPRTITNQNGANVVSDFIYTGKAARLANLDEIKAATTAGLNETNNELASYTFLLENTASYGDCRSNYWLETTNSDAGAVRIDGSSSAKRLGHRDGSSGVRPVIEVPYASIDGIANIVEFDTIPAAMRTYFNNVSSWNSGQDDTNYSSFNSAMTANLNTYDCVYYQDDNVGTEYGTNYCDQPNKYDTGVTGNINVYEYNESTGVTSNNQASYVFNDNGKLYNFIPGKTYYWVSATDSTKNGYVRPTGERRLITIPGTNRMTRNVRDLGGLPVDTDGNGTIDGKIKYQKIYRGEKIWGTNRNGTTRAQFEKLGIYNELDLRTQGSEIITAEEDWLSNYDPFEIVHYKIDHTEFGSPATETQFNGKSYYQLARDAAIDVMQQIVAGNDDYAIYFHCRIGADRTGTLAYILEGLLGVPTEYRHQDYELTTFFGLRERTRYYLNKGTNNYKFLYLKKAIRHATPNNDENTGEENVMDWFLLEGNSTNECNDISALITQFRAKMIDYNS